MRMLPSYFKRRERRRNCKRFYFISPVPNFLECNGGQIIETLTIVGRRFVRGRGRDVWADSDNHVVSSLRHSRKRLNQSNCHVWYIRKFKMKRTTIGVPYVLWRLCYRLLPVALEKSVRYSIRYVVVPTTLTIIAHLKCMISMVGGPNANTKTTADEGWSLCSGIRP